MEKASQRDTVNIRPGVSVLSVLRHLNYRAWFALAEFVDNAIQSFQEHGHQLRVVHGTEFKLHVNIEFNSGDSERIVIRDNAAGIHEADFPRAFRPAAIPPDRSGLGEFGMGMKSAACWFAPEWSVRTSALGEAVEKRIVFNIGNIVRDELEELDVQLRPAKPEDHYTEIVLFRPYKFPAGRTLGKVKEHLTDIYRVFTREGGLVLRVDGEELVYQEPEILVSPSYRDEVGPAIRWRSDIQMDLGGGLQAHGFAAIRKVGSTSKAGFALFRRKRLIQGSGDDGYRPERIFGKSNSFIYQRVFGELHLEGFEVSHTKDGFRWDENEEPFLELLREHLSTPEFPLLQQAREFRVGVGREALQEASETATARTAEAMEQHLPPALASATKSDVSGEAPTDLPRAQVASRRIVDVDFEGRRWRVVLELSIDPGVGNWLDVSQAYARDQVAENRELLGVRVCLAHPFMERYVGADEEKMEIVVRLAAALGIAEKLARDGGVRLAGAVRDRLNQVLRDALSMP